MGLSISFWKYLIGKLTHNGYRYRRWNYPIFGARVYEKNGNGVVVITTIDIPPSNIQPIGHSIDDYFRRLQKVLNDLGKVLHLSDVYFAGGGNIPIPDWFRDWCNCNGIHLHIIDTDNIFTTNIHDFIS